jgi:hypothetical protein
MIFLFSKTSRPPLRLGTQGLSFLFNESRKLYPRHQSCQGVRPTTTHLLRAEVKNEWSYNLRPLYAFMACLGTTIPASGKFLNAYKVVKDKNSTVSTHIKSCRLSMRQGEIDISVSILNSCQGSPVARPSNHAAPQRRS